MGRFLNLGCVQRNLTFQTAFPEHLHGILFKFNVPHQVIQPVILDGVQFRALCLDFQHPLHSYRPLLFLDFKGVVGFQQGSIHKIPFDRIPTAAVHIKAAKDALVAVHFHDPRNHLLPTQRADNVCIEVGIPAVLPMRRFQFHNALYLLVGMAVDNRNMVVPDVVDRNHSRVVPDTPMGNMVNTDPFLKPHITNVLLVLKEILKGGLVPRLLAPCGRSLYKGQLIQNVRHGDAVLVHFENHPHNCCLVRLDDDLTVLGLSITIGLGPARLTTFKPLANAPFQVFGDRPAFLLCKSRHDRQDQFGYRSCRVQSFLFKIKLDTDALKMAHIGQTFDRVAGKSRDTFCHDIIDLACLAILHHPQELFTLFHAGSADALIGVDIHQHPARVLGNLSAEGFHLLLQAVELNLLVRADTGIDCNADCFQGAKCLKAELLYPSVYLFYCNFHVLFSLLPFGVVQDLLLFIIVFFSSGVEQAHLNHGLHTLELFSADNAFMMVLQMNLGAFSPVPLAVSVAVLAVGRVVAIRPVIPHVCDIFQHIG